MHFFSPLLAEFSNGFFIELLEKFEVHGPNHMRLGVLF